MLPPTTDASSADTILYEKWARSHSPADLEAVVKGLDGLIQSEVNRRAGTISRELLTIQAKKLAVDAVRTYNPNMGVRLSTHVTNQLQKLSRVNYAHQNAARIPEHSMLQFHTVNIATEDFKADQGREPTTHELADALRWSPKKVEQFRTQFGRSELVESIDTPGSLFVAAEHDPRVEYVYSTLTPRQQLLFEYLTGFHGKEKLSNTKVMAKLGITQGVLSYEKTKLREAFTKGMS